MKKLTTLSHLLCRYVSYCSMAALVIIMGLMTVDVLLRHLFNRPITGGFDIVTLGMTILVFSSWSYAQVEHGHVHVTMFVGMMPPLPRFICFGFTSILSAGVMGFATAATFQQVFRMIAEKSSTGTLLIPFWPFMALECLAFAIFTLVLALDAAKAVGAIFSKELAREVQAFWS
jgi:TRAP-type C4-dicarboxylate transport system permease small subunit